jgi:protein SCO1/2
VRLALAIGLVAAALAALAGASPAAPAGGRPRAALPDAAAAVDIDEHLGAAVPLDVPFTDSLGRPRRLRELLDGRRPVILILAYYRCPMLCDLVLAGVSRAMERLGWAPGRDYLGLTVSIDPKDTPLTAHVKQAAVLQAIGRVDPASEAGWPFLVGPPPSVRALADAVGFRYAYDPQSDQFAHPAVAAVLTPDGRISRYLYGVDFRLLDVRLALSEAARGRVGGIVARLLLTCFRYDPSARRYGFYVSAVLKGGASLVILTVGSLLAVLWRRDARRTRRRDGAAPARGTDAEGGL